LHWKITDALRFRATCIDSNCPFGRSRLCWPDPTTIATATATSTVAMQLRRQATGFMIGLYSEFTGMFGLDV
jgi:hypothetical protein